MDQGEHRINIEPSVYSSIGHHWKTLGHIIALVYFRTWFAAHLEFAAYVDV